MSSIGTGYDLSASIFSPSGRIFQTEYSYKAVENSGTAIGLRGKDGVVLAVEYLVTSKLHEKQPHHRVFTLDTHVGMAGAGLMADSRMVAMKGRQEARDFRSSNARPIPIKELNKRVASFVHNYTLLGYTRPVGTCALIGGYTKEEGPSLYMVEPSGVAWGYYGCAAGKGKQPAQSELEKLKLSELSMRELVKEAAKIIYTIHDDVKDKQFDLFMTWVGDETGGKHEFVPEELVAEAKEYAEKALESDDEDEDEDED